MRMKKAGIDLEIFSMWFDAEKPSPFVKALRRIDTLDAVVNRNPQKIMIIRTTEDLLIAIKRNSDAGFS